MKKLFLKKTITMMLSAVLTQAPTVAPLASISYALTAGIALSAFPLNSNAKNVLNEKTVISIKLNQDLKQNPVAFNLAGTNKIVVDFIDAQKAIKDLPTIENDPLVESITSKNSQSRTRIIVDLKSSAKYSILTKDKEVLLVLEKSDFFQNLDAQGISTTSQVVERQDINVGFNAEVQRINFKKEKNGVGKLTVDFSDLNINPNITRNATSIIIDLKDVSISPELQKRVNTSSLGVPTKTLDVMAQQNNTKIILEQKDKWDYSVYQMNKKMVVEVKPISETEGAVYKGKPLSINFQNMDVRAILQVIADFTSLNIMSSDAVQGAMTIRLKDVPWDQALDLVLEAKNLQKIKEGNVIWVATRQEVADKNKAQLELQNQVADLEPLALELFQLNHHKADQVKTILMDKSQGILSKRGTAGVDPRNNMLFVQDTPTKIEEVKRLLKKIDIAARQVLIEAKIVIADDQFKRELGAKFGIAAKSRLGGNNQLGVAGNLADSGTVAGNAAGLITPAVNFAASSSAAAIGFTLLNTGTGNALGLELSALEGNNRGKIISTPRLLTTDNKKAIIEQGSEIPYVTPGSANSPATVSFKKAVMSLGVTPQIAPNGRIIMNLQIRKDSVGELVNVQGGGQVPAIDTKNVETEVTVSDGQTVVLGGVYEITNREDIQKVPFLGDMPFLGNMFKFSGKNSEKAELLIFITPYVVEDEDLDTNKNTSVEEFDFKKN